jgi:hypothetical protein
MIGMKEHPMARRLALGVGALVVAAVAEFGAASLVDGGSSGPMAPPPERTGSVPPGQQYIDGLGLAPACAPGPYVCTESHTRTYYDAKGRMPADWTPRHGTRAQFEDAKRVAAAGGTTTTLSEAEVSGGADGAQEHHDD